MSALSAASGPAAPGARITIGQVLDLLREDFPGVTIPKIRFLEDRGLITPERTPAGYRKFSDADVERLRFVLRLQRDHYLPLRVIGEHLDALDAGLEPPALPTTELITVQVPTLATGEDGLPTPEAFTRTDPLRLSRRELLKVAAVDEALLTALEQYGLLAPVVGTSHYDADALLIARTARDLAAFGVEPRHLRAFRTAADREIGLVEQVLAGRRDDRAAALGQLAALSVRLHTTLVAAGLRRPE